MIESSLCQKNINYSHHFLVKFTNFKSLGKPDQGLVQREREREREREQKVTFLREDFPVK
jgi:hypothetical protein